MLGKCTFESNEYKAAKNTYSAELFIWLTKLNNLRILRTLTQARKVINAIIRLYGSPARIHIETARELGKSYKDRKDIEKRQEQNRVEREKALYEALKSRLTEFKDDPAKAFAEPFYKKGGQQVKSVRVEQVQKSGVVVRNGNGVADNASMVRVDVFIKGGKFFLVPIYTWQVAKGILPDRAVIGGKDEKEWEIIDDTYQFAFTLYSNDLVELKVRKGTILGYYVGLDRATASISIREHDNNISKGKEGLHRSLGVKTALSFQKYQVDELGKNIRPCRPSKRQGLR